MRSGGVSSRRVALPISDALPFCCLLPTFAPFAHPPFWPSWIDILSAPPPLTPCTLSRPSGRGTSACSARPLLHMSFPLLRLALNKWCPVFSLAAHLPHFRRVVSSQVDQGGDVLPFSTSYYLPVVLITTSRVYSQVGCWATNLRGSADTSSPWTRWIPVPPPRGSIASSL